MGDLFFINIFIYLFLLCVQPRSENAHVRRGLIVQKLNGDRDHVEGDHRAGRGHLHEEHDLHVQGHRRGNLGRSTAPVDGPGGPRCQAGGCASCGQGSAWPLRWHA